MPRRKKKPLKKRKARRADPLGDARDHIKGGAYLHTSHAEDKKVSEGITLQEILMVFESGEREPEVDKYEPFHDDWKYSVAGETIDKRKLRVIFVFDEKWLSFITTFEL